ncbi:hypothetical protein BC828DRAFT_373887 [Blastocladiella britannica]|nr:hypothetical protein BC828DRAFT_373887 [Blastocladiella britannica]
MLKHICTRLPLSRTMGSVPHHHRLMSSLLSNLLNGNEQIRAELEQTHSKALASDASVTEFCYHRLRPGAMSEYTAMCVDQARDARHAASTGAEGFCAVLAPMVGDLDTVVRITTYPNYAAYELDLNRRISTAPQHERDLRAMITHRSSIACREFAFWAPDDAATPVYDGIYELRSYVLKPGTLLQWGQAWTRGVEARRQLCTPVGAWFSQLGGLNQVFHLWHYKNLEERKISREKAWELDVWAKSVKDTVPLLQTLNTSIMKRVV